MNDAIWAVLISILLLLVLTTLPLVPSIVIYKLFPNTTVAASGPLSGLTLRSSGAFSIYIIVFGVMAPFAYKTYDRVGDLSSPAWTITGKIILKGDGGQAITDPATMRSVKVTLKPDLIDMDGDSFVVKVPEFDRHIPRLTFSVADLGSTVVNVNDPGDYQVERDEQHMTIQFRSPIIVRLLKSGAYNLTSQPLVPAAGALPIKSSSP